MGSPLAGGGVGARRAPALPPQRPILDPLGVSTRQQPLYQMYPSRWKESGDRSIRDKQVVAMANWVQSMGPWDTYATFTFARECSVDRAWPKFARFMKAKLPGVSYFGAVEKNPDVMGTNPGSHVHALLGDLGVRRKQVWEEWFKLYGINRVLPIVERHQTVMCVAVNGQPCAPFPMPHHDAGMTVADYCSKYVCKDGAWWDVKVSPWRIRSEEKDLALFSSAATT